MRVAVLLPGILGSSLYYDHSGQRHYIWREDFATNYQTLISNPAVLRWTGRAAKGDLIETVSVTPLHLPIHKLWDQVLRSLARHPDFSDPRAILEMGYDWRRSLIDSGTELLPAIDAHLSERFPETPSSDIQLTFVTHSMGGLLVRAAVGAGSLPAMRVDRVVHIGSPLQGAPDAFRAAYEGCRLPFLRGLSMRMPRRNGAAFWDILKSSIQTFPSIYQLMPFPGNDFLSYAPSSRFNPFDPSHKGSLPAHHFSAATKFHTLMSQADTVIRTESVPVYTIMTERHARRRTDAAYLVKGTVGVTPGYEIVDVISTTTLGDGTVLADSARGDPSTSSAMPVVGVMHVDMCRNKRVAALLSLVI